MQVTRIVQEKPVVEAANNPRSLVMPDTLASPLHNSHVVAGTDSLRKRRNSEEEASHGSHLIPNGSSALREPPSKR